MSPARDKRESWQRRGEVRPRLGHINKPETVPPLIDNDELGTLLSTSLSNLLMKWSSRVIACCSFRVNLLFRWEGGLWMCSKCDTGNWVTLPPRLQVWTRSNAGRGAEFLGTPNIWQQGPLLTHNTTSSEVELLKRKKPAQFPGKLFVSRF